MTDLITCDRYRLRVLPCGDYHCGEPYHRRLVSEYARAMARQLLRVRCARAVDVLLPTAYGWVSVERVVASE